MSFPFMGGVDPSKLKPETLMQLTKLVQELPPSMLTRMQTLMHNAMAGFDVRKDMEEFERNLPAGFREKMAALVYEAHGVSGAAGSTESPPVLPVVAPMVSDENEARLTILRAVAGGSLSPEEALEVLFPA
jgi:hypothetical protein